jgi:hypothetical protein
MSLSWARPKPHLQPAPTPPTSRVTAPRGVYLAHAFAQLCGDPPVPRFALQPNAMERHVETIPTTRGCGRTVLLDSGAARQPAGDCAADLTARTPSPEALEREGLPRQISTRVSTTYLGRRRWSTARYQWRTASQNGNAIVHYRLCDGRALLSPRTLVSTVIKSEVIIANRLATMCCYSARTMKTTPAITIAAEMAVIHTRLPLSEVGQSQCRRNGVIATAPKFRDFLLRRGDNASQASLFGRSA